MAMISRSSSRNGQKVIWLALHTTEGNQTARDLLNATWWTGSSHAIVDMKELLTPEHGCVPYDRSSWTLRNGNAKSENIEQTGMASWTRDFWLTYRMPQLKMTAQWLRERSLARGIPLTYIGIQGVREGRSGVIQHNDYSKGTGDGSHWDCGPGYPIDVVIDLAKTGEPPKKKGPYDMAGILWKSPKGQLAYQDGPLFIGIDQATADQLFGQGIIQVKPNQVTWDALAAGLATGQSDADEAAAANPPAPPIEP